MANEMGSWALRLKTKALAEMELIKAGETVMASAFQDRGR